VTSGRTVLERDFYEAGSVTVAPLVLNKLLARVDRKGRVRIAGRVVEVEAYTGAADPASHAFRGLTRRNAIMFGPPGHLYVYFTYGMHWCANFVCSPEGIAQAVLVRALSPVSGIEAMRAARGGNVTDRNLLSGPARLCQAFGITGADNGADLVTGDMGLVLMDDGVPPPERPDVSGRVGIRQAAEVEWRFFVAGDPNVSKARPVKATAGQAVKERATRPK
jgi:DNA-3-methyladenine glycosylase